VKLLLWLLLAGVLGTLVLAVGVWLAWRKSDEADRVLIKRIGRLRFRAKVGLARSMFSDRRIPLLVRAIPPLLVLYLALPIDIVPDFIPVLGQLDDLVIVAVGMGLLLRFTPRAVLVEHLSRLEVGG
jgi:uncharacterized membrane protein YkvA (DUF1232 family)